MDEDGILPPNLGKNYSFCMAFKNLQDWTIIFYLHPNLSIKSHNVRMKKIHDHDGIWPQNLGKNNCTTWISKIHQFSWWFCIFPPNLSKSIQYHKDCKISPIWTIILYFENYAVPYGFQKFTNLDDDFVFAPRSW